MKGKETRKGKWLPRRVISWLLATLMVLSTLGYGGIPAGVVHAREILETKQAAFTSELTALENDTVYFVDRASYTRESYLEPYQAEIEFDHGISVSDDNVAYLFIPKDYVLNLKFSNENGISVEAGASLEVVGGGTLQINDVEVNDYDTVIPVQITLKDDDTEIGTLEGNVGDIIEIEGLPNDKDRFEFEGYYTSKDEDAIQVYDKEGKLNEKAVDYVYNYSWIQVAPATLYAHWKAIPYTITLDKDAEDAEAGTETLEVVAGEPVSDIELLPTRAGYEFLGYSNKSADPAVQYFEAVEEEGTVVARAKKDVAGFTDADGKWIGTADVTLKADWNQVKTAVTYDQNSGTGGTESRDEIWGAAVAAITVPTRTNYKFQGYYYEAEGTDPVQLFNGEGTVIAGVENFTDADGKWISKEETLTLKAKWGRISTLNYYRNYRNNDNTYSSLEAVENESVTLTNLYTRSGYVLAGYYTQRSNGTKVFNADGTAVAEVSGYTDADGNWTCTNATTDVYAQWSRTVTVTFNKHNGTCGTSSITVNVGEPVNSIEVPTRAAFEFAGYYTAANNGTKVFNADGTIIAGVNNYTDADGNWTYASNASLTLHALWNRVYTNVTFENGDISDATGGNGPEKFIVGEEVKKVSIPSSPTAEFAGYYTSTSDSLLSWGAQVFDEAGLPVKGANVLLQGDIIDDNGNWLDSDNNNESRVFYARWNARATYNIAYYDREWANSELDPSGTYNTTYVRTGEIQENVTVGNFVTKTQAEVGVENHLGYEFLGWSMNPNATEADYIAGKQYATSLTTEDGATVNLYAIWKMTGGANIGYNGNGSLDAPASNIPADAQVIFDKDLDTDAPYAEYTIQTKIQPVREGYKFIGWSKSATDAEDMIQPGDTIKIYEDTVFYAQWKKNPQITYEANGGVFTEEDGVSNAIPVQSIPEGTNSLFIKIVNPRATEEKAAIIQRPGYTFVGWTAKRADGVADETIYSSGNVTEGDQVINETLSYNMPDTDIVLKAKWQKNKYKQGVTADKGNDVYTISYTGTYNDEGTDTEISGDVTLTQKVGEEGPVEGVYEGELSDIPHGANIELSIKVDGKYNAENLVVTVNGTVYKPASKSVEAVEETDAEDKQGATTFVYKINDIIDNTFGVDIVGASRKEYTVSYELFNDAAELSADAVDSYFAGDTNDLADPVDKTGEGIVNNYTFAGWYETEADALEVNEDAKVTSIEANKRGNKTYYAGWTGKKYTVTFNKLYGTTGGKAEQTQTQEFAFGKEEPLKTIHQLFDKGIDELEGPDGAIFLGWALTEQEALDHVLTYTDGQNVLDLVDKSEDELTLWAAWDKEKVTISFNANGGKFSDDKVTKTGNTNYNSTAAELITSFSDINNRPIRAGYKFAGWTKDPDTTDEVDPSEVLFVDDIYYAIWTADEHTFQYYKDPAGGATVDDYTSFTANNGDMITIGVKNGADVPVNIPEGMVLIGWTTTRNGHDIDYVHHESVLVTDKSGTNLYPVFSSATAHIVAYSANGGNFTTTPDPQQMIETAEGSNIFTVDTITVTPKMDGYYFVGWADKLNPSEDEIIKSGDPYTYTVPTVPGDVEYSHVLYAIWEPITYTVTFKPHKAEEIVDETIINKAEANTAVPVLKDNPSAKVVPAEDKSSYVQTFTYDDKDSFETIQYDYPGFVFKGWSDSTTGSVIYKDAQEILNMTDSYADENKTPVNFDVYAIWALDTTLTVTYRPNGGNLKQITPTIENPNPEPENVPAPADQIYARIADTLSITTVVNDSYERHGYTFVGWGKEPKVLNADATAAEIAAAIVAKAAEVYRLILMYIILMKKMKKLHIVQYCLMLQ